jgi:GntR family transcriptional regulator
MKKIPIELSQTSGIPFYRQIVDQIAMLIRSGELAPGAQLPSVRDLASQILVSLITVRRAYSDLDAAGLITRRQGYGTYVSDQVTAATKEQSLAEGRRILAESLDKAHRNGLSWTEIGKLLGELLANRGKDDEQR